MKGKGPASCAVPRGNPLGIIGGGPSGGDCFFFSGRGKSVEGEGEGEGEGVRVRVRVSELGLGC